MTRTLLALGLALLVACGAVFPSSVSAQRASETVQAREQFRRGIQSAHDERWDDAVDAFQRSYELVPRSTTLFNLAGAYTRAGRLVEAYEAYRLFLQEGTRVQARMRRDAESQVSMLEPRLSRVTLVIDGIRDGDRITIDQYELSTASVGAPLPVNAGSHEVAVVRGTMTPVRATFTIGEGERREVTLDLSALVIEETRAAEAQQAAIAASQRQWYEDPLVWGIAGGVIVVGVGVVIFTQVPLSSPFVGNLGPGQITVP